ncbi:hypothetical protein BDN67DRAFT_138263 [Paxillus ammoniavirescens]|nr:hypothetical protein BDN67DRAFT_138263 [Paxillus ammoniavirescens]
MQAKTIFFGLCLVLASVLRQERDPAAQRLHEGCQARRVGALVRLSVTSHVLSAPLLLGDVEIMHSPGITKSLNFTSQNETVHTRMDILSSNKLRLVHIYRTVSH